MRNISLDQPRQALFSAIDSLLDNRMEFLTNPVSDFSRVKKISFVQTILFPMIAGSDNTASELMDFFDESSIPLPSSMIQRRNQINNAGKQIPVNQFPGREHHQIDRKTAEQ